MAHAVLQVAIFLFGLGLSHGREYCKIHDYVVGMCPNYCCGSRSFQYCCSQCSNSINYHSECAVSMILGGIVSLIIFLIVILVIIAICRGCICSSRTGITRRGRVLSLDEYLVVTNPNYRQSGQFILSPAQYLRSDNEHLPGSYPKNQMYTPPPPYFQEYGTVNKPSTWIYLYSLNICEPENMYYQLIYNLQMVLCFYLTLVHILCIKYQTDWSGKIFDNYRII